MSELRQKRSALQARHNLIGCALALVGGTVLLYGAAYVAGLAWTAAVGG